MFQKIVSNLSFSPQATGQLTYYLRRLRGENLTRRLSAAAAVLLIVLQIGISIRPAVASKIPTSNDIVYGGLGSADPASDITGIYDQNHDSAGHTDYVALFNAFHIRRSDLAGATKTSINSSDHELLSIGRNANFASDVAIPVNGSAFSLANPYACDHHLIKAGDNGDCVKHLQWYLTSKFTYSDLINDHGSADGIYGSATKEAVQKFQYDHKVGSSGCAANWTTCDGIAGPATWDALHGPSNRPTTQTYYQRPLYQWADNYQYEAITSTNSDGDQFWIMLDCGNIVVKKSTPKPVAPPPLAPTIVKPTTAPPPVSVIKPTTPPPTPVIAPAPVIAPPPTIITPKTPTLSQAKSAVYLAGSSTGSELKDANGTTASGGDIIEYTLKTTNSGNGPQIGYITKEQIGDLLFYSDILDYHGSTLAADNTLSWPKQDILPGSSVTNKFTIKIKNPIPATPVSPASPLSFDLRLDNVYGNAVSINLAPPAAKQLEAASTSLPQTGAATSLLITMAIMALTIYFYLRNRQLMKEVQILRVDHNPGV